MADWKKETGLVLTERAINMFSLLGEPVVMEGFAGYLFPLPKRFRAILVITLEGSNWWGLVSTKPKQEEPSRRAARRAIKYLIKGGVLEEDTNPFPELTPRLEWKGSAAVLLRPKEEPDLTQTTASITFDDSLEGLEDFSNGCE